MANASLMNPIGYVINRQYSDSLVIRNRLFKERLARANNLFRKDLLAHYGCVNAVEFSEEGELLVSGGDDRRVLLWSVPEAIYNKGTPVSMQTSHISNIFCLGFDSTNSKIFSGGNDDQVIVHDTKTTQFVSKLLHKKPVYGLSVNPQNDYVIATAGDDGRILIYDVREPSSVDPLVMARQKTGFHAVMYNPTNSRYLATANSEDGIALWDSRKPKEQVLRYGGSGGDVSGTSVRFNSSGTRVLALRRRLPPVLYATESENLVCQFYHPQYYNSCTMKTCSFAGDNDEYVLSGSDDFNLYMWKIPEDGSEWGKSHLVLTGHRSIVNQVRYNKQNNLIASSGVEKMVKLWTTLPIGLWTGSLLKNNNEVQRPVFSHDDYMFLVGYNGQRISHDYSDQSTQEDSRMMAFFDSLIQREIEGWDDSPSENYTSDSSSDEEQTQALVRLSWESLFGNRSSAAQDGGGRRQKPNRIAQLIAQKRERLAKMARWKSRSCSRRYESKQRHRKHKLAAQKLKSLPTASSSKSVRKSISSKSPSSHSSNAKTENASSRKHKLESSDSTASGKSNTSARCKVKRYRTRQSVRESHKNNNNNNNNHNSHNSNVEDSSTSSNLDMPSTSTGITASSNSVYRIIEDDSDDEVPSNACSNTMMPEIVEQELINILPTPLNGTHDMYSETATADSHAAAVAANRDALGAGAYTDTDSSMYESEGVVSLATPDFKVRNGDTATPESGIGSSGPCSSSGTAAGSVYRRHLACSSSTNGHGSRYMQAAAPPVDECSDADQDYVYERFKQRVKKARLNIRNQIFGDSDSN